MNLGLFVVAVVLRSTMDCRRLASIVDEGEEEIFDFDVAGDGVEGEVLAVEVDDLVGGLSGTVGNSGGNGEGVPAVVGGEGDVLDITVVVVTGIAGIEK